MVKAAHRTRYDVTYVYDTMPSQVLGRDVSYGAG
jgi:hypothetical protein